MKAFINSYCDADELRADEYGESFFRELSGFVADGKISEADAVSIIACLVDIDEIRILFTSEIRKCIAFFAETGNFSPKLLDLFRKISLARFNEPDYLFTDRMRSLLYGLTADDLSLEQAINSFNQSVS